MLNTTLIEFFFYLFLEDKIVTVTRFLLKPSVYFGCGTSLNEANKRESLKISAHNRFFF